MSLKWCRELSAGSRSPTTTDRYVLAFAYFSGEFSPTYANNHIFRSCGDTNLFAHVHAGIYFMCDMWAPRSCRTVVSREFT